MRMRSILLPTFLFIMISAHSQVQMGDSLMAMGDFSGAIRAYENSTKTANRFFKIARANNAMGDLASSYQNNLQGMALDSVDVRARYEYGKLLYRLNQPAQSYYTFKNLIDSNPDVATYHYHLGKSLIILEGDLLFKQILKEQGDDAGSAFAKALQLNHRYRSARIELVKILIRRKAYVRAIKTAKTGLAQDPDDIKLLSLTAQAMMASKQFKAAIKIFEKLFELKNDTAYNRKNLALAYFYEKEMEKSLENYELYLADNDDQDADVYFMISKTLTALNRLSEAQQAIERTMDLEDHRWIRNIYSWQPSTVAVAMQRKPTNPCAKPAHKNQTMM